VAQGGAAVVATAAVYFVLPARAAASPAAVAEELVRASGFTALIWAYAGLLVGLGASTRLALRFTRVRRPTLIALHRQLNLVALALTVVHVTSFVVAPGGSLLVALVPQTAQVGAVGYTLGVLALYLAVLLGPSWYLRERIGRWTWLLAHQLAALSYATALWHTLLLGGDVRLGGGIRTALWAAQAPLLVMLGLRLSRPRRPADHLEAGHRQARFATHRHAWFRLAVHTGIVATFVIVLLVGLVALAGGGQHATR
jgi:sulfoxide reductase heme-binding subunit YedZ